MLNFSGKQKKKIGLILDKERYRYRTFLSDISGVDIKEHHEDYTVVIRKIRTWLHTCSRRITIPSPQVVIEEFNTFSNALPKVAAELGFELNDIPFNDYCYMVEEEINRTLS